jgi:O-6-methylguanine DNA methyltransferase
MDMEFEMKRADSTETVYLSTLKTRFGVLNLASSERGLLYVAFPGRKGAMRSWLARFAPGARIKKDRRANARVEKQLREYLEGRRRAFDLPLDLRGTPFQKKVWRALTRIPCGRTASYGAIARKVGNPGAARAVGGANNSNPAPIVVPCHRVIGSDGSLTGFGGGIGLKKKLLELEGCVL